MNFVLCVASILFLYLWWKWKIAAAVLAAWMAEKNIAPPEKDDYERLQRWVVRKWLKGD